MADTRTLQQKLLDSAKKALDSGKSYDQLTADQQKAIDAEYSFVSSLIVSDDNLRKLFTAAVKQQWTPQRFQLEAQQNEWFKGLTSSQEWFQIQLGKLGKFDAKKLDFTNSETAAGNRAYVDKLISGSKDLTEIRDNIRQTVQDYVVSFLGLDISNPENQAKIDSIATDLISNSYNPYNESLWQNQVRSKVAATFKGVKAKDVLGTMSKAITDIAAYSRSMGMPVGDESMDKYVNGLLDGSVSQESIIASLRKSASQMWSQFSDRINAGETLENIIYPYTQVMGSMLEIDPSSIDFLAEQGGTSAAGQIDPLLQKALLSATDSKGVMTLTDFRKAIKSDNRWQYTKNAKDEYATLTSNLMRMFGAGV